MVQHVAKLLKDDFGIAYGYFIIALFLVAGSALWIFFLPFADGIVDLVNSYIGMGNMITINTANVVDYDRILMAFTPIIMIIGVFLWGVVRAREERTVQ